MKKDRVAILLAYIGTPFHGLQYQRWKKNESNKNIENIGQTTLQQNSYILNEEIFKKNYQNTDILDITMPCEPIPTIENTLIEKLKDFKLLKESNCQPDKCHIRRACRTDKGVSAVLNIVSLCVEKIDYKNILQHFNDTSFLLKSQNNNNEVTEHVNNDNLLSFIHIYKIIKVPKSFNPKFFTSHRTYSYLLPKDIFHSQEKCDYTKLLEILFCQYLGTKNFHNFTKRNTDKGTTRYISGIKIINYDNFWEIMISGQSFMMHQIRKMIGLIVLIIFYSIKDKFSIKNKLEENHSLQDKFSSIDDFLIYKIGYDNEKNRNLNHMENKKNNTNKILMNDEIKSIFAKVFSQEHYNVPKSPSEYLFLNNCEFKIYNEKCKNNSKNNEPLIIEDEILDITRKKIKETIMKTENMFIHWKECIEEHFYEYSYL